MGLPKPHFFPAFVAGLSSLTFVLMWVVAGVKGSIHGWPFHITEVASASDLQAGLFTIIMNVCALATALIVYIRFKEVQGHYRIAWVSRKIRTINRVAMYVGWVSTASFTLATTFQVTSQEVKWVHFIGALVGFGFGILYLWLQVLASWKLMGSANSKVSLGIRVSLAALAIYAVTVAVTANLLAHCTGKGDDYFIVTVCNRPMFGLMNTALLDQSQESLRILSCLHEWLLVCIFNAYFLTFTKEFRNLTLDYPTIIVNYQSLEEEDNDVQS